MDTKEPQKKSAEYFHSLQDFAEKEVEKIIEEDLPPPPPMFSEEELEEARQSGFKEGQIQGLKEALDKTEKKTADLLGQIKASFTTLLADEHQRQDKFEAESVLVTFKAIQTLFPLFEDKIGEATLKNFISQTLQSQNNDKKIKIFVHPDYLSIITTHIPEAENPHITFSEKSSLDLLACEMEWANGGAVQNINLLCEKLLSGLQQLLEDRGVTSHDDESEIVNEPSEPAQAQDAELNQESPDDE